MVVLFKLIILNYQVVNSNWVIVLINAAEISRDLGYKYVEGIAVCKTSGDIICHAWNIDNSERAVDVTFTKTTNYDYFGIEIPFSQIWQIGKMNGGIWYCSLPYLKK